MATRDPWEEAKENAAMKLLLSRRGIVQAAATTSALLATQSAGILPASAAKANAKDAKATGKAAAPLYDLKYDLEYNKAPGQLVVLPDGIVETSESDKKQYRALTLPNGLRVLLASDPKTDTAAAALDVHVGHFSDPADVPGLAHFCEHMLFLGTEKFPKEGELEDFLSRHGGQSNAYTATEDTCYFFSLNQDALQPALERFSQFFVSPLFTAAATDRELNAIESENAKNLNQDSWRLDQLQKTRYNPDHPVTKFGTGNKFTLKEGTEKKNINLRAELLKFHDRYYSANMMTLSVCGRESLDTLQQLVVDLFSNVPNKDVPPPEAAWAGKIPPLAVKGSATGAYNVVPVNDERSVVLSWVVPYTSAENRRRRIDCKPSLIVGALLGGESKGSLLSYLKDEKEWVTSLGAAVIDENADFEVFACALDLTSEGLKRKEEVIESVFSYIKLLQTNGVPEYTYEETKKLSEIGWRFRETQGASSVVNNAAASMQSYPDPARYLSGPSLVRELDTGLVTDLLTALKPEDMLVTYASQSFAPKASKTEYWYKTKYSVDSLKEALPKWQSPALMPSLTIPAPNPFIPTDFTIKTKPNSDLSLAPSPPDMIIDGDLWRVHFKPDNRYGQPKAYAFLQISQSKDVFGEGTTPHISALARLLKASLQDALNEFSYDAAVAGLSYSASFTARGISLSFSGYNDKLPAFVETVAAAIANHVPSSEEKLQRFKDTILRDLSSFKTEQPYRHASFFATLCKNLPGYLPTQVAAEVEGISLGELAEWARGIWKTGYAEALIQGNLLESDARNLIQSCENSFKFEKIPEPDRAQPALVQLPIVKGGYGSIIRNPEPNPTEGNSAVYMHFQSVERDLETLVAMEMIGTLMEQPFYSSLRTQQQLGYIVFAGNKAEEGTRAVVLTVQSSIANADYLAERMFEFIEGFDTTLQAMSDEQFSSYVQGVVDQKLEKDKKLSSETLRHWGEIVEGEYKYDRDEREAAALKQLTRDKVIQTYRSVIKTGGEFRRPLTSLLYSQTDPKFKERITAPIKEGSVLIPDGREFVMSQPKVPRVKGNPPIPLDIERIGGLV